MKITEWTELIFERPEPEGMERLALVALSTYAGPTGEARPSVETLARDCAVSVRSMRSLLSALERQGYVVRCDERGPHGAIAWRITGTAEPATVPNPVTPRPLPSITDPDDLPIDNGPQPAARPTWEPTWPRIISRAMYLDPEHPWRDDCPQPLLDWLAREGPPDHDDWVWALMSPRAVPLLNHESQPYLGSKTGPR